jgi:hypothetical protein
MHSLAASQAGVHSVRHRITQEVFEILAHELKRRQTPSGKQSADNKESPAGGRKQDKLVSTATFVSLLAFTLFPLGQPPVCNSSHGFEGTRHFGIEPHATQWSDMYIVFT